MRRTLELIALLLLVCGISSAQEHPAVTAQPNTVFVGADGKFEAAPDTALLQFNVSAQEDTSKGAYDHAARNIDQIKQTLRANGIDVKLAEISFVAVQPVYDWKSPKRKLIGYRVNSSVSLKLKDFAKIGPIMQHLADSDITENQSVSYTLENMDAAKAKAVEDAYRRARESADALGQVSGRAVGVLSYASIDTFEQMRPTPVMTTGLMIRAQVETTQPTAEFSPQNVTVTAHVNALFTLK